MALNTSKCNYLPPLPFKGLTKKGAIDKHRCNVYIHCNKIQLEKVAINDALPICHLKPPVAMAQT